MTEDTSIFYGMNKILISLPTEYELTTVTFGLPPSPYQAQRVLKQLAQDEGEIFPQAADVLLNYVYVDDLVMGAPDVENALNLRN